MAQPRQQDAGIEDGNVDMRLPVDFMLKRSVVRGNLKNIRKWKRLIFWSEELGLYPENILPNVTLRNG